MINKSKSLSELSTQRKIMVALVILNTVLSIVRLPSRIEKIKQNKLVLDEK